jgi:hypothetical protein
MVTDPRASGGGRYMSQEYTGTESATSERKLSEVCGRMETLGKDRER